MSYEQERGGSPYANPNPIPSHPAAPAVQVVEVRKRSRWCWFLGFLAVLFFLSSVFLLLVCVALAMAAGGGAAGEKLSQSTVTGSGEDKILLIRVEGIITSQASSSLFGGTPGTDEMIHEQLLQARKDPKIRGVILRINSPGGQASACETIYQELLAYRKDTNQKMVALFDDTAASGGYYIASAADRIVAHPMAITGSIGVIMELVGVQQLLGKIGVEMRPITSAPHKDMASASRPLSDEDRAILQGIVNELHARFVEVVTEGFARRGVTATGDEIRGLADGMIYTGKQAMKRGLVDEVGYLDDAVARAKAFAGVAQVRVITYHPRRGLLGALLAGGDAASAASFPAAATRLSDTPHFMYLWTVGQDALLSTAKAIGAAMQ